MDRAPAYEAGGCRIVPYTTHQLMVSTSEVVEQCVMTYVDLIDVEDEIDEKLRASINKNPFADKHQFILEEKEIYKVNRLKPYYSYHGWTMLSEWHSTAQGYKILLTITIDNFKYLQGDIGSALTRESKRLNEERKKDPTSRSIKVTLS